MTGATPCKKVCATPFCKIQDAPWQMQDSGDWGHSIVAPYGRVRISLDIKIAKCTLLDIKETAETGATPFVAPYGRVRISLDIKIAKCTLLDIKEDMTRFAA